MRVLLLTLALLSACTPVTPPPPDSTQPAQVRLQATMTASGGVRLTLQNDSSDSVGYNLCSSQLQRGSGANWTAVPVDEVCTMELRTLAPGGMANHEKRPPAGLSPGEYRYVTSVEIPLGGTQRAIASNSFSID